MSEFKRLAIINLIIILVYSLIIRFNMNGAGQLGILVASMYAVAFHFFTLVIISVVFGVMEKGALAKAYIGNAGLVLLIGFSVCWGNASI